MSQRERRATGEQAVLATPAVLESVPVGSAGEVSARGELCWESFFAQATPVQQGELLALATRQGLVYAQQLPKVAANQRPIQAEGGKHNLLTQVASGQTGDLPLLRAPTATLFDAALDASQTEAVSRALTTPDVCLIQGFPGTGKSRVVAEIIRQAARKGERILFLAANAAALDCVLEQLAQEDYLFPLRCLEPHENRADLPLPVRRFTIEEQRRALHEQLWPKICQAQAQAESICQRRQQEEALWPQLEELADQIALLQKKLTALQQRRETIPGAVHQEGAALGESATAGGNGFVEAILSCHQRHRQEEAAAAAASAGLAQERTRAAEELTLINQRLEQLRTLSAARKTGRWWSLDWWRAAFRPTLVSQLAELEQQQTFVAASLEMASQKEQQQQGQRQQLAKQCQEQIATLIAAETARRLAALAEEEESLLQRQRVLEEQGRQLSAELEQAQTRPGTLVPDAVARARALWLSQKNRDEEANSFSAQWAQVLKDHLPQLSARLPLLVNLVAATVGGWAHGKLFGEVTTRPWFDLLILEEADQIGEADTLRAASYAVRWVLVGEPARTEGPWVRPAVTNCHPGSAHHGLDDRKLMRSSFCRPGFFQRLWDHLHCDPSRLPYSWGWEGSRLCCRLRPLSPEQRSWLESERLADAADIELRILAMPRARPVLVEVVFPPAMTVAQAKEFIFRELQELPIQPAGRSWCWLEDDERLTLRLAEATLVQATPVTVAGGVQEWVGSLAEPPALSATAPTKTAAWFTGRLEFAKSEGWHRDHAHAWIHSHLPLTDLGRTVSLQVSHRMQADLSKVLSDLLFGGTYVEPQATCPAVVADVPRAGAPSAVEFVAVPPLSKDNGKKFDHKRKKNPSPNQHLGRLPGEGAGLELDLTTGRLGDRLPADLRADLPCRGFVNYPEAQAVVRKLETIVQDPGLQSLANGSGPVLAVLALYAAQAELIRRLIGRSAILSSSSVPLVVGLPQNFRHREFHVVLLSLTRSHAQQPVSYGASEAEVSLAMTRARSRLILFGDPGTLVRRSRWQGGLEQLDQAAAAREGQLAGDLVRYLQGQGRHSQAFLLCESNGP